MKRHPFAPTAFMMWGGLLVWAAQFMLAYVITALACARRFAYVQVMGINLVTLSVSLVSLMAIAATLLVMRQALNADRRNAGGNDPNAAFIRFVTVAVGGFALLAIILVALPPLVTPPGCELR